MDLSAQLRRGLLKSRSYFSRITRYSLRVTRSCSSLVTRYSLLVTNQKGLALILVVSVLTVAAIMAVSFAFTMMMETKAAANYQYGMMATYLTQAGIAHAREVLKADKAGGTDTYGDSWRTVFQGSDTITLVNKGG